jgi:hypothetical protein
MRPTSSPFLLVQNVLSQTRTSLFLALDTAVLMILGPILLDTVLVNWSRFPEFVGISEPSSHTDRITVSHSSPWDWWTFIIWSLIPGSSLHKAFTCFL